MFLDLVFPARGATIAIDHVYPLYGALTKLVPAFHQSWCGVRFNPIGGIRDEPGRLLLTEHSQLRVRLPSDAIPTALPLAGKVIDVAGSTIRLGPPTVYSLRASTVLEARLVTFKHGESPDQFLATAKAKFAELVIAGEPAVRKFESGPRTGEPRRRVVRVKGKAIIGYAMVVTGLSADESLRLQERGLGGRTRMGCGFFLPAREASDVDGPNEIVGEE